MALFGNARYSLLISAVSDFNESMGREGVMFHVGIGTNRSDPEPGAAVESACLELLQIIREPQLFQMVTVIECKPFYFR